jgi:predicted nucleotidyltransferase
MINNQQISLITNFIIKAINPLEIVLFGSYARNTANEQSDLDIFIMLENEPQRSEKKQILKDIRLKLFDIGYPVDIIINSKERYEKFKKYVGTIFYDINKEGVVLWTRQ